MKDIHDVLNPFLPPNYSFFFNLLYFFLIIGFLAVLFFLIKKFFKKKRQFLKIRKFFFDDLKDLSNKGKNDFNKKLWKDLSFSFKKYISEKKHSQIFFLSFGEIKNEKNLLELKGIFEDFEKEFYSFEKKGKNDFENLIKKILEKVG